MKGFAALPVFGLILAVLVSGCTSTQTGKTNSVTGTTLPSLESVKQLALNISYNEAFRNNENYVGRTVYFRGGIIQCQEVSSGTYIFRVATGSFYGTYINDILLVNYQGSRLLEGDIIDIWGKVKGLQSYQAVLGNTVTIPEINALYVVLFSKAGSTQTTTTISSQDIEAGYENRYLQSSNIIGKNYTELSSDGKFTVTVVRAGNYSHLTYGTFGDEVTNFRIDIKVKNSGSYKGSFYLYDVSLVDNLNNQYDTVYGGTFKSGDMEANVTREGYLLFDPKNADAKTMKFTIYNGYPADSEGGRALSYSFKTKYEFIF